MSVELASSLEIVDLGVDALVAAVPLPDSQARRAPPGAYVALVEVCEMSSIVGIWRQGSNSGIAGSLSGMLRRVSRLNERGTR